MGVKCVVDVGLLGRLGLVVVVVGLLVVPGWICWLSVAVMNCTAYGCTGVLCVVVVVPGSTSHWL